MGLVTHSKRHARRNFRSPKIPNARLSGKRTRDDFAAIESDLQIIMGQLARLPDGDYASRLEGLSALMFAVALIPSL
jgi:hypothetical protein